MGADIGEWLQRVVNEKLEGTGSQENAQHENARAKLVVGIACRAAPATPAAREMTKNRQTQASVTHFQRIK